MTANPITAKVFQNPLYQVEKQANLRYQTDGLGVLYSDMRIRKNIFYELRRVLEVMWSEGTATDVSNRALVYICLIYL